MLLVKTALGKTSLELLGCQVLLLLVYEENRGKRHLHLVLGGLGVLDYGTNLLSDGQLTQGLF